MIYFLAAPDVGRIKIGYTGDRLDRRMRALRFQSPVELRLIVTAPGLPEVERQLHSAFRHSRIWGEWFRPTPDLTDLCDKLLGLAERNRPNVIWKTVQRLIPLADALDSDALPEPKVDEALDAKVTARKEFEASFIPLYTQCVQSFIRKHGADVTASLTDRDVRSVRRLWLKGKNVPGGLPWTQMMWFDPEPFAPLSSNLKPQVSHTPRTLFERLDDALSELDAVRRELGERVA